MTTTQVRPGCHVFNTKLGWMGIAWNEECMSRLTFGHTTEKSVLGRIPAGCSPTRRVPREYLALEKQLKQYARGDFVDFSHVQIDDADYTPFQRAVVDNCRQIAWGKTMTYGELAKAAGSPRAARAVGSVMSSNRFPIVVPCHRVVSSTGDRFGGFTAPGGVPMKKRMLVLEKDLVAN